MIIHDLVTPLNSVRSLFSLLQANAYGPISEKGRIRLSQGEKELDKLAQLLDDLLELEQIASGRLLLCKTVVDLDVIVESAMSNVQAIADQKSTTINFERSQLKGMADPMRLIQVITDLLSNAIKFSPEHSSVNVRVFRQALSVLIQVQDYGIGICENMQAHIFQGLISDSHNSGSRTRSGLGLAICKAIVEEHGGDITVDSRPGEGSIFTVVLPD